MVIYYATQTNIQNFAISLIYFLFNQLIVAFPVIFLLLLAEAEKHGEPSQKVEDRTRDRTYSLALGLG